MKFCFFLFLILASQTACKPNAQTSESTACQLTPGEYDVQSAVYKADQGHYELMVLNAPACFQQPLKLSNVQLARFESEGGAKVRLTYGGDQASTLHMVEDFQITMVQTVTENGVRREHTGSWSPFLTGLAGGVAGAVAGNMLSRAFNKPQYYTPPPMQAGQTNVRGFGGVGDTKEGAVRSYQQKYANRGANPAPSAVPQATETKRSFFKTKTNNASPQPGAARSYQPAPRKGFFKSRRR